VPVTISLKRNTPNTEKMKKNRNISAPTFASEGKLKSKVSINFCKPLILRTNFSSLVTLKTLITRINCGPILKNERDYPPNESMEMSTREEQTTKKSNLFHPWLR